MENFFGCKKGLNSNIIKIIALLTMTIDHIGVMLFPTIKIFRIIGRISFPLFAFCIAEGCKYTKNRLKHFLMIFILGVICQVVFYFTSGDIFQGILISFSLSILLIYSYDYAIKTKKLWAFLLVIGLIVVIALLNFLLPLAFKKGEFYFDYGFTGIMLAFLIYIPKNYKLKVIFAFIGTILVAIESSYSLQWWSLFSIIILAFYNGKNGKLNIKYLFYIYYPLHFAILYGIQMLIG